MITEIVATDPMRKQVNHGLMVQWINADLLERCGCDVRTSVVCYDADGVFAHAFPVGHQPSDSDWEVLRQAGVHTWSKGIV